MDEVNTDIVDLILENKLSDAENVLLVENTEDMITRALGGKTLMNYLMKFEEYLDDHDVYMFDGWEDGIIPSSPKMEVSKFWVTIYMIVPINANFKGAKRLINDKEAQNQISYTKINEKQYLFKFKILKKYLDELEQKSKDESEDISDDMLNGV